MTDEDLLRTLRRVSVLHTPISTTRIHADQIETDEFAVGRLLADQFPRWADLPVTRVSTSGTESGIFRLGDEMAV